MNKKQIIIIISAILILLIVGVLVLKHINKSDVEGDETSDIISLNKKAIESAGIASDVVKELPVVVQIKTTGQVKTNEDKRYTLNAINSGRIVQDNVKLGEHVTKGQVVAEIQNPEVIKINSTALKELHENRIAISQAQTRLGLAKSNYVRENKLYKEGISPQKDLLQAKSDMILAQNEVKMLQERSVHIKNETRELLKVYGVNANLNSETLRTTSPITAIRSGVITKKNITIGSVVTPEQVLYEVQDLSQLWIDITLYSDDIAKIKEKQTVKFYADTYPNKEFKGVIDYIQPTTDEPTQTFKARTFIDNSLGLLKPGMFGTIIIDSDVKMNKPFVPDSAIQRYGKEVFVFYDLGDGKYKKQNIELGEKDEGGYFVNSGISANDKIVVKGSFTLKAEMLKSEFAEED